MLLPEEIILFFFGFLTCKEQRDLALTSKKLYSLWQEHVKSNLKLTINTTGFMSYGNSINYHSSYCLTYSGHKKLSFLPTMIASDTIEIVFCNSSNNYYRLLFTDSKYEENKDFFDYLKENYVAMRKINF